MSVWVFVLMLCCPFSAEHTVTFEVRTEKACQSMRRVITSQIAGYTLRATVTECAEKATGPPP